ncbi:hypothetical protein Lbir_0529 [Legionella birminghamensis]|uniref:Uncharacterized protein n=1 Tax=Legionella birminghamensis TaxID=28083 RepID=A0A378IM22_9GAMM|nr:hypothetical protein [Legionella birminghamensis]KTC75384.1 hypothetical protein Lbir_0529 [Legionella birminghamensis]STX33154.1 Uncharacterised protein [Legionella birminghamensis]
MTISLGDLKKILDEFSKQCSEFEADSESERLSASLASLTRHIDTEKEKPVEASLKNEVILRIDQFWHWATNNIVDEKWRENTQVGSWIELQNTLERNGFSDVYTRHYPFVFERYSEEFNKAGNISAG